MEATGSPVLSIMPLSAGTADSAGNVGNLQKTTEITGNSANGPSELFSSILSQLTLAAVPLTTPETAGIEPVITPVTAAEGLPLSGNLLPPSIHPISIEGEIHALDDNLVTALNEAVADTIDQAELQPQLEVPGITLTPVSTLPVTEKPAAAATTPVVTTLLTNSVLAKPQTTTRPVSENMIVDGEPVFDDAPAPVLTATREIPGELVTRSDNQHVINPPIAQSIVADGSNAYTTAVASISQPAVATTTSQTAFTMNHPITDPQWGDALSQRVIWMTQNGMGRAEIRLNPSELGPLNVSVTVANDEAKVAFNVQHGTTRELVEAALPRLREMFAAQGMDLTDATVSQQSPNDRHHASDTGDSSHGSNYGNGQTNPDADNSDMLSTNTRTHEGLIDTYV